MKQSAAFGGCVRISSSATTLGLFALLLLSTTAEAASPDFSLITPRGAQRGTEVDVVLRGARLEDAQEILLYEPGIEVAGFEVVSGAEVKAKFKIAPDTPLGVRRMRVRTATGVSELRTFFIGALPVVAEVEPNSEFEAPQSIAKNVTIDGVIANEDVDYFVIEAKKGERISVEVEAIRLGNAFFDVYVAILNEARFELATSDDKALVWQDGTVSLLAPEDGKYIVQVRDSAYGGGGTSYYRCHIGNFPRPSGIVPAGGKPGETVAVRFLGDSAGEFTREIKLPDQPQPEFGVFAQDDHGIAPSWNWFRLSDLGNVIEQEPNNALDAATKFQPPMALNGVLSDAEDLDYFRFTAKKGEVYDVRVYGRELRSSLDSVLTILNANGGGVANNDDTGGPDSYLRFTAPADGDFIVHVRDHLGKGGPDYTYRIELTTVQPSVVLTVNEFVQYIQPTVSIPRGNRTPLLLSGTRKDFGGPLDISAIDLPEGVTIESPGMPADLNVVPVIFHATPEAAVSGKLARVLATLNDPNQAQLKVEGNLQQTVMLVRGQNNRPVWTETVQRLPVAVTDEAPFSIQIVEPKVPVVQGGPMELKVVAQRKEGFTAPIKIDMLWDPPGISSSRSVSIAEGQTEASITLNAAGNAPPREWKIAVRGEANTGNGNVMVATPFATLRTSERYLNFTFQQAAIELGQEAPLLVTIETAKEFEGPAKVQLLGLPNKVTTEPTEITKDAKEITFKIKAEADAPPGQNKNLFCQVVITENGEPIVHNLGTGVLRVDKPLPPKVDAPAVAKAEPAPAAPQQKPLSRLEQLRLEQKARLEAGGEK